MMVMMMTMMMMMRRLSSVRVRAKPCILYNHVYILIIPRNAYNMAKIRGTVRGSEGGTVRGWRSKK